MSIEVLTSSLGLLPFLIEDGSLFLQINLIVQGIIVEFRISNSLSNRFNRICLIKYIHSRDNHLHHLLIKDLLHDDNAQVALELLNGG